MEEILEQAMLLEANDNDIEYLILNLVLNDDNVQNQNVHPVFNFDTLEPEQAKQYFRFEKQDIPRLVQLLGIPDIIVTETGHTCTARVRILYVSNIPAETSSGNLKRVIISRIDALADHITRVFRKRRYAFVHFDDRFSAESALELLQESDITIKGQRITFEWARPQCYSKSNILNSTPTNFCTSVSIQRRKKVFAMKTEKKKFGSFSSGPTSSSSTPNSNTPNSSTPNSNTPNNSTPNSSEASSSPRSVYSNEENWY
ncbi:uncharacterized protein LOC114329942 [Diabrotica virgifera virgifera]|uniref:RRM domain-containing protein n=1 Tax=Diabrotica virgifera virgifera TaxID=50390 RepID=A0ABM5L0S9_DIAVI|nr:uncharacterized protein LOC114329942 [Diabrotica virgifera virgifera]